MCVYNCSAVQTKGIRITFTDGSLKPPEFFFSPAMNVPLPCVCSENGQGQVYGGWMLYTVHGALCLYLCVFVCVCMAQCLWWQYTRCCVWSVNSRLCSVTLSSGDLGWGPGCLKRSSLCRMLKTTLESLLCE